MARRVIRVGGVHEPFNLPFVQALRSRAFAHLGVDVTFSEYTGGTGEMVSALGDQTLDIATLLTEGAVTAIGRGADLDIHSVWAESPLRWGVHVAADSAFESLQDLAGARFAISRFGSGSELMAYELADAQGWDLSPEQFVVVANLDGAVQALPGGDADVFLWERYVTAPLCRAKVFRRLADMPTRWPAMAISSGPSLSAADAPLVKAITEVALAQAATMVDPANAEATIGEIRETYGMGRGDTRSWLSKTEFAPRFGVDRAGLTNVRERMVQLGRIGS